MMFIFEKKLPKSISMNKEAQKELATLGSAIARACEDGLIDRERYGELAATIAAGLLTGNVDLDDYAEIHEALASALEAVFSDDSLFAAVPEEKDEGFFAPQLEVIEDVWSFVDDESGENGALSELLENSLSLKESVFGDEVWFSAPLEVSFAEFTSALKRAGVSILHRDGTISGEGKFIQIGDAEKFAPDGRVVLGWGEHRVAISTSDNRGA
ncbi:MAG: hypothetical protein C0609_06765 [Deltaproteobacteria bacterium]|nr:MAG: hypothetical protein C0609_06765 [Deltaproteobacteria bacterium]